MLVKKAMAIEPLHSTKLIRSLLQIGLMDGGDAYSHVKYRYFVYDA
jgi:hypothetical protein